MHPSSGITKEYSVTLDRKPRQEQLEAMAEGCLMGTPPVLVQPLAVIRDDTDSSKMNRIRVIVAEGRNREVGAERRGRARCGHAVGCSTMCVCVCRQAACILQPVQLARSAWLPACPSQLLPRPSQHTLYTFCHNTRIDRYATWWSMLDWR